MVKERTAFETKQNKTKQDKTKNKVKHHQLLSFPTIFFFFKEGQGPHLQKGHGGQNNDVKLKDLQSGC